MNDKYRDILSLPHHVSDRHKPMSLYNRAAQFAPFAALNGHEEALDETARLTDHRIELSTDEQAQLSLKLHQIIDTNQSATITHFVCDPLKSGGTYQITNAKISKLDETFRKITLDNGIELHLDDIYAIN